MSLSVIIPSKNVANLDPCVRAVQEHDSVRRIFAIDDGLSSDWQPKRAGQSPLVILPGVKPFVYARNCNLGIAAAGDDDVILLNDDALLQTPGGFTLLQKAAQEHPEFGVVAAVCNNVGNRNQWQQNVGLREDQRIVCFVAVLIPRRTIDLLASVDVHGEAGLLDERFGFNAAGARCYGHEDDDYCYRVRRAGLKIGIHDGCFVDHGSLRSTFRGDPAAGGDLHVGRQIFADKWGSYPL